MRYSRMNHQMLEAETLNAEANMNFRKNFVNEFCPEGVTVVGKSPAMKKTLSTIKKIAKSNCNPVLVVGDSGTGKELAARAVHFWRNKSDKNFVAVNCAALTANLLESELFGHVKGAFTGADREKVGLFEAAGEGTIFLDEISEMPIDLQAKLLRVIQEKTFRKVGSTKVIKCKATIVASSNRNLLAEAKENNFRLDLYYRLAVFPIKLPGLASSLRKEDIPLLAEWFIHNSQICSEFKPLGITTEARDKLLSHNWPGNVRELRNVIERALILEDTEIITAESIIINTEQAVSDHFEQSQASNCVSESKIDFADLSLEAAEREFITRALRETNGQRTKAASLLGITRATLHSKLKRYGISPETVCETAKSSAEEVFA